MTLLSADSISKRFADKQIFKDLSFTVTNADKIGLVGKNGAGKTTLFEIVVGNISPDSGTVTKAKNCMTEYVLQETRGYLELSLTEFVLAAREDLIQLGKNIANLEHTISIDPDNKSAIEKLGQLQHKFELEDGFRFENDVTAILDGLGFDKSRHNEQLSNFSGGEKNRAALARILAGRGNLLLLDEPTNHLDIESTTWLEEFLHTSGKAYIIVSHDRSFLSATVDSVWELRHGQLDTYYGGFEKFLNERVSRKEQQEHLYKHQQAEIARLEDYIRRNMAGQKTKQAQSKQKFLNRLKRIEAVRPDNSKTAIQLTSSGRSFAHVLSVSDASLGYGSNVVIENITVDLYRGDKVALLGRNGSGKSTFIKALTGELGPMSGEIKIGAKVDPAYFDQELENLNEDLTVLESAWRLDPMVESGVVRSYLARFGFTGDETLSKVSSLSGGEKTKLSLALLLYHPANFLILDEPTNHLDIDSREALERALLEYDGTCLIVSHDRYFLNQIANRVLHIENGFMDIYEGNYSYFKEKRAQSAPATKKKKAPSKNSYIEFKKKSKRIARHQKEIRNARERLNSLERELELVEHNLNSNIPKTDWEKLNEAAKLKKQLEESIVSMIETIEKLEATEID